MTVLALAAPRGTSARAVPLLGLLGVGIDIVSWEANRAAGGPPPDAVLATSTAVLTAVTAAGPPVAVWVDDLDDLRRAEAAGAAAVLSADPALVDHGAVLVPDVGVDVARWDPVAPLIRARWRERHGLPAELVVGVDPPLDPVRLPGPLSVAAAAVVTGSPTTLALALALAAPVVTDADSARRLALRPGLDVEVTDGPHEMSALAARVALDGDHAAALSRRGRRHAERHLDLGVPARSLRRRLGLVPPPPRTDAGRLRLDTRLDELATPARSRVRARAADALALFPPLPVLSLRGLPS